MTILSNFVLLGMTIAFFTLAIMGVFWIDQLLAPVEVFASTPSARAELRAIYGGGFGGLAFACYRALRQPSYRRFVFALLVLIFGLFSVARSLTSLVDGPVNPHSVLMHALENVSFILALLGWWHAARRPDEGSSVQ